MCGIAGNRLKMQTASKIQPADGSTATPATAPATPTTEAPFWFRKKPACGLPDPVFPVLFKAHTGRVLYLMDRLQGPQCIWDIFPVLPPFMELPYQGHIDPHPPSPLVLIASKMGPTLRGPAGEVIPPQTVSLWGLMVGSCSLSWHI